ncbi:MAG: hypothetical protein ACR2MQ_08100 [Gemmatimonadaceae bacterium]
MFYGRKLTSAASTLTMSEVLVQFDEPQPAADGRIFIAQVNGQRVSDGLWEAWIEFYPNEGGEPVSTRRETEQLTRGDLRFWAAGLTRAYLSTALARALSPARATASRDSLRPGAMWSDEHMVLDTNRVHSTPAALDPMETYRCGGEYRLRQELRALDAKQLRDVIAAYDIPEIDVHDVVRTFEDALAERVVAAVQQRVGPARAGAATPRVEQLD